MCYFIPPPEPNQSYVRQLFWLLLAKVTGYCAKSQVSDIPTEKRLKYQKLILELALYPAFFIIFIRWRDFVRFKLFTANESLIVSQIGELKQEKFSSIIDSITKLFAEE